jgi:uncharacterized protein
MIKWQTQSGKVFFQDNKTNTLYDENMNKLSRDNPYQDEPKPFTGVHRTNRPAEIKIVLGHDCNYSCGYCVQKDVGDHNRKVKHFDPQFLISRMRETLDLSNLDQLELWGGETLLYWDEITPLMLEFDGPDMDFVIPTNGTILTERHIDFFLSLQGRVTIEFSHDSYAHSLNRGHDPLPKLVEVIRKIQANPEKIRMELSTTVTNTSFKLIDMSLWFSEFFKKHNLQPVPILFRPVWSYDAHSEAYSLDTVLNSYQIELDAYLNAQMHQFKTNGKVVSEPFFESQLFHITINTDENNGILQRAANFRVEWKHQPSTICGMHRNDHLTIDNMGNIRACQNTSGKEYEGNILDFKYKETLPVSGIHVKNIEKCQTCPVYLNCLSGCPLSINEDLFEKNCKVALVHEMTMLRKSFELLFGEKVEIVREETPSENS